MRVKFAAKPVRARPSRGTVTDVIVPFHGQYDKVHRLLKSLLSAPVTNSHHLCLVDDGSPNPLFLSEIAALKVPYVTTVRLPTQSGFGAALRAGLEATSNPFVVFAHSDCVFEEFTWMEELLNTYISMRPQKVKMVSARTNNSTGGDPRLTAAKGSRGKDAVLGWEDPSSITEGDKYLPFFCALAHRELFSKVGFVKSYPLAMYEDVEFACRMYAHGYNQAVSARAWVHHEGGRTVDAVCRADPRAAKTMESNFDRLRHDIRRLGIF